MNTAHRAIAAALKSGQKRAIWLGALALRHPAYADLRALAAGIAAATGATLGTLAEGGNAAGAYLAGVRAASRCRRHQAAPRPASPRATCSRRRRRPIYCSAAPSPGPMRCGADALQGARRRAVRGRGDAVRRRDAEVRGARAAADLHVRRDLGHLRESRRPVAELCRRGAAAGRGAPGLEGAARARQSRRARRLRLPVLRRSARGTARALRATSPRRPTSGTHAGRSVGAAGRRA